MVRSIGLAEPAASKGGELSMERESGKGHGLYIQDQDKHDIALDKLSVKEYEDPFKGGK